MEEKEILTEVNRQRTPDHRFIKWWRREHDFLNFELLAEFDAHREERIKWLEGFELLDTEQMWQELQHRFPERVSREKRTKGEFLVWQRPGREPRECLFTPENIMTLFNAGTRGNVID
ncbi:MAG: hypothetical protein WDA20_07155 [Desulfuromonadales bacterium]